MPLSIFNVIRQSILVFAISLYVVIVATDAQQTKAKPPTVPLKLEQISDMVLSGLNSVDILVEAKARGLDFVVSADVLKQLEEQGADALLLNWLGLYSVELKKLYSEALKQQHDQRFGRVVEVCGELLSRSPRLLHIYLMRGSAFRAQQQLDRATDDFRQALKYHPNSSRARVLLADTLIERKQTDEAIRELNWVTEHRSAASIVDWPTAHRLLAAAYLQRGDYPLASQELHTALWQSPLPDPGTSGLLSHLDPVASELARLLALCPDPAVASPQAALELATLLKLLAVDSNQQQMALIRLAEAQAALGQFSEAVESQRAAEVLKGSAESAAIAERLALYRKQQLPRLPAGISKAVSTSKVAISEVTPASLLAKMKKIEPPPTGKQPGAVTKPFLIGKYEVTVVEWARIMGQVDPVGPDLPVDRVSWDDCQIFIKKLNDLSGKSGPKFRLPTVDEFRLVSQHPKVTANGDPWQLSQEAWYAGSGGRSVHQVGLLHENAAGLFDVLGNVAEWCADDATTTAQTGSKTAAPGFKTVWGGSYLNTDTQCLSQRGAMFKQNEARRGLGLRLAADADTAGEVPEARANAKVNTPVPRAGIARAIDAARGALQVEPFQRTWLQERLLTLLYLEACVKSNMKDVDGAMENLRALIRETPEEGTALIQLARCHLAWLQATRSSPTPDQLAEGRKIVEVALTRSEFRLWMAYLAQSAVLIADGQQEDAIRRANQAHDLAPAEFKALCKAQLDAIQTRKKAVSPEFPVPPLSALHVVIPE